MIPRLETEADMRETARWMRYPPTGIRGVATGTRGAGYATVGHPQVHELNDRILGVFQVESRAAVAAIDDLAAIDGVDVLFVGPRDLSHDLGVPGDVTAPAYLEALETVRAAAARHGKACGLLAGDGAVARRLRGQGWRFVGIGSDSTLLAAALGTALAAARTDDIQGDR